MSSTSPQDEGSSIFPFLAVLVCAMGALIFLLIALTQRIKDVADTPQPVIEQTTVQEPELRPVELPQVALGHVLELEPAQPPESIVRTAPEVPPPDWPPAFQLGTTDAALFDPSPQRRAAQMKQLREQEIRTLQQKLQQITQQLAQFNQQTETLKEQLRQLASAKQAEDENLRQLQQQLKQSESAVRKHQQQLATTSQKLLDLNARYQQALLDQKAVSESTEFIAIDSMTGERRKPIIIECMADRIAFQPQNVSLSASDFLGFSATTNPLVIGTRYLLQDASNTPGSAPYVLVLVREGGVDTFRLVQTLLSANNFPMGYELVTSDVELHFPKAQPQSSELLAQLLEEIRRQQRLVYGNRPGHALPQGTGDEFTFSMLGAPGSLIDPIKPRSDNEPASQLTDLAVPGMQTNDPAQGSPLAESPDIAESADPFHQQVPRPLKNPAFNTLEQLSPSPSHDPRENAFRGIVRKPKLRGMSIGEPIARPLQPIKPDISQFEQQTTPTQAPPSVAMPTPAQSAPQHSPNQQMPLTDQELASLFQSETTPSSSSPSSRPSTLVDQLMAKPIPQMSQQQSSQTSPQSSTANFLTPSFGERLQSCFQPEAGKLVIEQAIDVTLTPRGLSLGGESLPFSTPLPTTMQVQTFLLQQLVEEVESFPKAPSGFQWQPSVSFSIDPRMNEVGQSLKQLCRELNIPFDESAPPPGYARPDLLLPVVPASTKARQGVTP